MHLASLLSLPSLLSIQTAVSIGTCSRVPSTWRRLVCCFGCSVYRFPGDPLHMHSINNTQTVSLQWTASTPQKYKTRATSTPAVHRKRTRIAPALSHQGTRSNLDVTRKHQQNAVGNPGSSSSAATSFSAGTYFSAGIHSSSSAASYLFVDSCSCKPPYPGISAAAARLLLTLQLSPASFCRRKSPE